MLKTPQTFTACYLVNQGAKTQAYYGMGHLSYLIDTLIAV